MTNLTAYEVTYKFSERNTITAIRFAENLRAAIESAKRAMEAELGCVVVSVKETEDPRK